MYDDHRVQRASRSRSLVDYLTRLGWCQDMKAKEGYLAESTGTLLVQFWAVKGVLEHHEHPPWLRHCTGRCSGRDLTNFSRALN